MTPQTYFWTWFTQNQKHFQNYLQLAPKLQKHYCFWLEWHLNYYSKGVTYVMVFPKNKQKKNKLIITANGRPEYFEKVEAIVKAAPSYSNWEVIAFVQPSVNIEKIIDGTDKPFVFQDIALKTSEIQFEPFEYENVKKLDLIIYLKYESIKDDYKHLMKVVYIIIESLLGEKIMHEYINYIELAKLPEKQDPNIFELYELQSYLEETARQNQSRIG